MISQFEMVTRLLMAAALGSVIGFERERLSWAAGLRTHMLVCVGSALVMIVSAFGFRDVLGEPHVELDPSRMAAQVVSGIGFLGAGTILLRGEVVRGLTTAASLWSVAAVGLAVGAGLYTPGIAATVIILLILAGLKPLETHYFGTRQTREFRLLAERGTFSLQQLQLALGARSRLVRQFAVQPQDDLDQVTILFDRLSSGDAGLVAAQLKAVAGVKELVGVDPPA